MSRAALTACALGLALCAWPDSTSAVDPHLDPSRVPGGCAACHQGHGESGSPMLGTPQAELCLTCHSTQAAADAMASGGLLAATAQPASLSAVLAQPFVHPLNPEAHSRHEQAVVTCTSCHSPHRQGVSSPELQRAVGRKRISTRDPTLYENELCAECHGSAGVNRQTLLDLGRLTHPNNASFHPLEATTVERSPSVLPRLRDREINCTDCHGDDDRSGSRGVHGSSIRHLLVREYLTIDGGSEAASSYALCYGCHDRQAVLDASPFPLHRLHVVDEQVSCATCHDAHGSVDNRALIRFGEEITLGTVAPSGLTGRLQFVSAGPGGGSCHVSCHGVDHAPASYGFADSQSLSGVSPLPGLEGLPVDPVGVQRPARPPRRPPPPP